MFLRIPTSMVIPEVLERLGDADFEDWLTALFIENASQRPLENLSTSNGYPSTVGSADIWMVEITDRTGKIWKGKFQVEFTEDSSDSDAMPGRENRYGEMRFALDTESAEIVLRTDVRDESGTTQQDREVFGD
jgi:hypothetical protein